MRRLAVLLALVGGLDAGCGDSVRSCKANTVLLSITLGAGTTTADHFDVALSLAEAPAHHKTVARAGSATSGSIEIDFPAGYPAGAQLAVSVVALAGTTPLGAGSAAAALDRSCTHLSLTVNAASVDLGGADLVGSGSDGGGAIDLAGVDLLGAKPQSAPCMPGDVCATGACVDGYCCDTGCTGQCEACDVSGQEGTCTAVSGPPHAARTACTGSPPCTAACDGANRNACVFPTGECVAASCAGGVATAARNCALGACAPATGSPQTCKHGCFQNACLGPVQMCGGYYHACAVFNNGDLYCWGANDRGQAAQASTATTFLKPVLVDAFAVDKNVQQVACTFNSTCALTADHHLRCWGANDVGQLANSVGADGNAHPVPSPVPSITDATFVGGSSGGHYCAIVSGGGIKCWGSNGSGELGDGSAAIFVPNGNPVVVCAPDAMPCVAATGATFVTGGDNHTCATFAGGAVACWGDNEDGQLGNATDVGMQVRHPFATTVAGLTATWLTAGNRISCAASGGLAKCWGGNSGGRLGDGTTATQQVAPVTVCATADCATKLSNVTAVDTYDESSCAVASGAVHCWGGNTGGQLGDGTTTTSQNYAASTSVGAGVVASGAGGQFHCAVVVDRAERALKCWGTNGSGELGDNQASGASSNVPVEVQFP